MKMFNMIGIGERAESGVPDIYAVWDSQGWKEAMVEEQYNPDRAILKLSFVEKQAIKNKRLNKRKKRRKNKLSAVFYIDYDSVYIEISRFEISTEELMSIIDSTEYKILRF